MSECFVSYEKHKIEFSNPIYWLKFGYIHHRFPRGNFYRVVYSISQFIWGSLSIVKKSAVLSRVSEAILRVAMLTTEGGAAAVSKRSEGNRYDLGF